MIGNFFQVNGAWVDIHKMRKIRAERERLALIYCEYCSSAGNRHMGQCPTRKEDFNPETAHKLTREERESEILARQK
jgi:hypothetical protein